MNTFYYSIDNDRYEFASSDQVLDSDNNLMSLARRNGIKKITSEETMKWSEQLRGVALMAATVNLDPLGVLGDLCLYDDQGITTNRWRNVFYCNPKLIDTDNLRIDLTTPFCNSFYLRYSRVQNKLTAIFYDGSQPRQAFWLFKLPDRLFVLGRQNLEVGYLRTQTLED